MSIISPSSNAEMPAAEQAVRAVLRELEIEWSRDGLADAPGSLDLFEMIDSFAVVELLLRTETEVETRTGRYVPLADDTVLDADKTPLRKLDSWIAYVAEAIARG